MHINKTHSHKLAPFLLCDIFQTVTESQVFKQLLCAAFQTKVHNGNAEGHQDHDKYFTALYKVVSWKTLSRLLLCEGPADLGSPADLVWEL